MALWQTQAGRGTDGERLDQEEEEGNTEIKEEGEVKQEMKGQECMTIIA